MADLGLKTKRRDRGTAILVQLKRGDGTIVDLTSKLTSQLTFHFKDLATGVIVSGIAASIVVPEADGKVTYNPTVADVASVAEKLVEVEYEDPAASGITETFPVCDRFVWSIVPDIA